MSDEVQHEEVRLRRPESRRPDGQIPREVLFDPVSSERILA